MKIIGHLYWNQVTNLKVEEDHVKIQRGVQQGLLSHLIFNLSSERNFKKAIDAMIKGILIQGHRLNSLRYAENTIGFAFLWKIEKYLELMNTIKARRLGKIFGRRGPGRHRISCLKNLRTWFDKK